MSDAIDGELERRGEIPRGRGLAGVRGELEAAPPGAAKELGVVGERRCGLVAGEVQRHDAAAAIGERQLEHGAIRLHAQNGGRADQADDDRARHSMLATSALEPREGRAEHRLLVEARRDVQRRSETHLDVADALRRSGTHQFEGGELERLGAAQQREDVAEGGEHRGEVLARRVDHDAIPDLADRQSGERGAGRLAGEPVEGLRRDGSVEMEVRFHLRHAADQRLDPRRGPVDAGETGVEIRGDAGRELGDGGHGDQGEGVQATDASAGPARAVAQ